MTKTQDPEHDCAASTGQRKLRIVDLGRVEDLTWRDSVGHHPDGGTLEGAKLKDKGGGPGEW